MLKDKIRLGEVEIPACIKEQILKFYFLAAAVFFVGVFITIMAFSWFSLIATVLLTFAIAGMGYYRAYEVSTKGYLRLEGECKRIEYTLASQVGGNITKDIPKRYLIGVGDQVYTIPYSKHNAPIQEGDRVVLYLKKDADTFEWKNIHTPDVIYGYEILYTADS